MSIVTETKSFLEIERKIYLKKTLKMLEHCINKNNDEAAATCIITAARELTRTEEVIEDLESLEETNFDWE